MCLIKTNLDLKLECSRKNRTFSFALTSMYFPSVFALSRCVQPWQPRAAKRLTLLNNKEWSACIVEREKGQLGPCYMAIMAVLTRIRFKTMRRQTREDTQEETAAKSLFQAGLSDLVEFSLTLHNLNNSVNTAYNNQVEGGLSFHTACWVVRQTCFCSRLQWVSGIHK